MEIQKVGVVGCGLMGSGIAQVTATAGFQVTVREVNDAPLDTGFQAIHRSLSKLVDKNKLTDVERQNTLSRLRRTTALADLKDSDLIIEAITENPQVKKDLFRELDTLCPPPTLFASNP
ncbi:MAG: 3-hydroxyacyl-CoA dehydrogenase family protein, partial [Terriglobia bacterium]